MPNGQFEKIRDNLILKCDDFVFEVTQLYENLVKPNWDTVPRRYYISLYGYVMHAFSVIDLLSCYWQGTASNQGQTARMRDFMTQFMHYGRAESKAAVVMWRHKLMHTSEPRPLVGKSSGKRYSWLLHWHKELPAGQHMQFHESGNTRVLMMSLVSFAHDLKMGLGEYLRVADRVKFMHAHAELDAADFDES